MLMMMMVMMMMMMTMMMLLMMMMMLMIMMMMMMMYLLTLLTLLLRLLLLLTFLPLYGSSSNKTRDTDQHCSCRGQGPRPATKDKRLTTDLRPGPGTRDLGPECWVHVFGTREVGGRNGQFWPRHRPQNFQISWFL